VTYLLTSLFPYCASNFVRTSLKLPVPKCVFCSALRVAIAKSVQRNLHEEVAEFTATFNGLTLKTLERR